MFRTIKNTLIAVFLSLAVVVPTQGQPAHRYEEDMQEVDEYLLSEDYGESLYILQNLEKDGFSNSKIAYKKGICYLNSVQDKDKAIQAFESATRNIDTSYKAGDYTLTTAPADAYLYLGDAFKANYKPDQAKAAFQKFLQYPSLNEIQKNRALRGISECLMAKVLLKHPVDIKLSDAGELINKGLANLNPCLSGDGKTLVFTRRMKFYDAIMISHKDSSGWTDPENITTKLGSDGDFYPTGLSFHGTKMLLSTFIPLEGSDIYQSELKDGRWMKVSKVKGAVNSKFNDIDAVFSPDDQWIYFSSNRDGGFGGYDLYKIASTSGNTDTSAINLGSFLNTPGNEKSPKISGNGKMLFFSSDLGFGMGGMDYYYTRQQPSGEWDPPCNAGAPFNTPSDDLQASFTGTSKNGMMAQYHSQDYPDLALYAFSVNDFSPYRPIEVQGKITMNHQDLPAEAGRKIVFIDPEINDTAAIARSGESGRFQTTLYPGSFSIMVFNNHRMELQQSLTISPGNQQQVYQIVADIITAKEKPKVTTDTLYITNIYFAFDKYNLTEDNRQTIDRIMKKAILYGIVSIKLTGYTDSLGNDLYNQQLSESRANAVMKYLSDYEAIPPENITTLGKGNTGFIAINHTANGKDSPEGRAFNRRVEMEFSFSTPGIVIVKKNEVPEPLKK